MQASPSPEERRLAFDARRPMVEMLVKIHLEQVAGARQVVTTHLRSKFRPTLGALAGVVTL